MPKIATFATKERFVALTSSYAHCATEEMQLDARIVMESLLFHVNVDCNAEVTGHIK
jgi:hypothetical protein